MTLTFTLSLSLSRDGIYRATALAENDNCELQGTGISLDEALADLALEIERDYGEALEDHLDGT